jgi:NADPH:quinone reductase-like Zn-dependent oxidoreductase
MAEQEVAMRTQTAKTELTQVAAERRDVMRAIVQDVYGSADRLRLAKVDKPVIAADEVLVQVRAAGVDRGTCHLMRGEPYLMRILGFGFRGPKNHVPGLDVAGTVAAVGGDVTRFQPGDEVFGISRGSFADYAAAREDKLVRKPAGLSFEQAAVVAVSGLAALQGPRAGRIAAGQKVLIIGASGGVGTYAVQLAKAFGAKVTGVARSPLPSKLAGALGLADQLAGSGVRNRTRHLAGRNLGPFRLPGLAARSPADGAAIPADHEGPCRRADLGTRSRAGHPPR